MKIKKRGVQVNDSPGLVLVYDGLLGYCDYPKFELVPLDLKGDIDYKLERSVYGRSFAQVLRRFHPNGFVYENNKIVYNNLIGYFDFVEYGELPKSIEKFKKFMIDYVDGNYEPKLVDNCYGSFYISLVDFVYSQFAYSVIEFCEVRNGDLTKVLYPKSNKEKFSITVETKDGPNHYMINVHRYESESLIPFYCRKNIFYNRKYIDSRIKSSVMNSVKQTIQEKGLCFDIDIWNDAMYGYSSSISVSSALTRYYYEYLYRKCKFEDRYFITKQPSVYTYRLNENNKKGTFDIVSVEIPFISLDRKTIVEFIKKNKKILDQIAMYSIRVNRRYQKYKVPVNCLNCTDIILRKDSVIEYKFQLKTELLKLQEDWEEE